jgi:hypothetical protein
MFKLVAFAVLALTTSACNGSGPTSSAPPASPCGVAASPILTPTPMSSGLIFKLNGINTTASGTVTVYTPVPPPAGRGGSVYFELTVSGLKSCSSHVSNLYEGSCEQNGNFIQQLNQVVADRQGQAHVMTTLIEKYFAWRRAKSSAPGNGTWYVTVHAGPDMKGSNAAYLLCGNLFT